jgi:hypothetical protein
VKTVNVEWTKDDSGRWQMNQVPGTEKVFPADLVLLAMGFLGPERAIGDQLELKLDPRSNFNTKDYKTNLPNVFAAGGNKTVKKCCQVFIIAFRLPPRSVVGRLGHIRGPTSRKKSGRIPQPRTHRAAGSWWYYSA